MEGLYRRAGLILILFIILFVLGLEISLNKAESPLIYPHNIDYLIEEASSHYYQGKLNESIALYNQAIATMGYSSDIIEDLIAIHKQTGNYDKVVYYYGVLINLFPNQPAFHTELGWVHLYNNNPEKASKAFNKSLASNSSESYNSRVYHGMGLSYYLIEDHARAISYYKEALEFEPASALIHLDMAKAHEKAGSIDNAINHYLIALRYDSSMVEIHRKLGELYLLTTQYEEALNRFERAVRVNPHDIEASNNIKSILSKHPHLKQDPTPVRHLAPESIDFRTVMPSLSQEPLLRIALVERANHINIMAGANFNIYDKTSGDLLASIEEGELLDIMHEDDKILILDSEGGTILETSSNISFVLNKSTRTFILFNIQFGTGYFWSGREDRQYRGELEIRPKETGFDILNIVPLEEYLYSVVPGEMPAMWPMEALKAQAIAARTYTVNRMLQNKHRDYDLKASVLYASYPGVTWEHPRSTMAINDTENIILTYNGNPINAVYSSNTGGHTESSMDVWGFTSPYLVPVSESPDETGSTFPLNPGQLERWLKTPPNTFSNTPAYTPANSYRWTRVIDRDELEQRINRNYNVGTILDISPLKRGYAGTVYTVLIAGTNETIMLTGDRIRTALGGLRSNRFLVEKQMGDDGYPERFYFHGSGWGHNVGMSQTGAAGMAELGYTYEDILIHYYPGSFLSYL